MSRRASTGITIVVSLCMAACVARQPPWRMWSRPPCAEAEERVERDRERIDALQASGARPDELAWYRDDVRSAVRALDRCKKEHPTKKEGEHENR